MGDRCSPHARDHGYMIWTIHDASRARGASRATPAFWRWSSNTETTPTTGTREERIRGPCQAEYASEPRRSRRALSSTRALHPADRRVVSSIMQRGSNPGFPELLPLPRLKFTLPLLRLSCSLIVSPPRSSSLHVSPCLSSSLLITPHLSSSILVSRRISKAYHI